MKTAQKRAKKNRQYVGKKSGAKGGQETVQYEKRNYLIT